MSSVNQGGKYIQTEQGRVRASVANIDRSGSVSDILDQIDHHDLDRRGIQTIIELEKEDDNRSTLIEELQDLIS